MIRFSLAILFAVLAVASRPVATGGHHDFLAVGVVVAATGPDGRPEERVILSVPTPETLAVYDALLESEARAAILQGAAVHAGPLAAGEKDPVVKELVFYGLRSRAGRAAVSFDGESDLSARTGAGKAALALAALPDPVTTAAARVLLSSDDGGALADALKELVRTRTEIAASEARALAADRSRDPAVRLMAIRTLKGLGGANLYPDLFRDLAADPEPAVAAAAK